MKSRGFLLALAWLTAAVCGNGATLEELASNPAWWPKEVTVTTATKAVVMQDGKAAGVMLLGAGRSLTVAGIAADGVTGRLGATMVRVPVDKTDLLTRAGSAIEEHPAPSTAQPVTAQATPQPSIPRVPPRMHRQLSGRLVRLAGRELRPVEEAELAGVKYFGLYYSASWCGPCREFTPQFVRAYRRLKEAHPEFEVVFVSADRSAGSMRDYMRDDRMPWLALDYEERENVPEIMRYCGAGIPCLVLVDAMGRVLSDSYEGDNYVGPHKVLADAEKLLQRGR